MVEGECGFRGLARSNLEHLDRPRPPSLARSRFVPNLAFMTEGIASRPKAREDVIFRQLDDEWVIFDPVTDRLHALNLTAALIWAECTGERTVDDIAREIAGAFDPPLRPDTVREDVREAVERFRTEGLVLLL